MESDRTILLSNESSDDTAEIRVTFINPKECLGTIQFQDDDLVIKIGTNPPLLISYFKILSWRHSRVSWSIDYKDCNNYTKVIELRYCDPPALNRMILNKINYFLNL